ncbi:MAG: transglycosylase SLT domain-containing protein [Bacteroidota bacterium]
MKLIIKIFFVSLIIINNSNSQKINCETYDDYFKKYSKRYFGPTFDWRIFKAQAFAESNLNPDAVSWVGAKGIMQIMPETYQELKLKNSELGEINDPHWNIAAGIHYNRQLWKQWKEKDDLNNKMSFVFGSYNAGSGTIRRAESIAKKESLDTKQWTSIEKIAPTVPKWRHKETLDYVKKIENNFQKLQSVKKKKR